MCAKDVQLIFDLEGAPAPDEDTVTAAIASVMGELADGITEWQITASNDTLEVCTNDVGTLNTTALANAVSGVPACEAEMQIASCACVGFDDGTLCLPCL